MRDKTKSHKLNILIPSFGIVNADDKKSSAEDEVEDEDEHSGPDFGTDKVLQMKDEKMSEEEVKEMTEQEEPIPCTICGQVPCDWDTFGEERYGRIVRS
jgi:hypothetical protein